MYASSVGGWALTCQRLPPGGAQKSWGKEGVPVLPYLHRSFVSFFINYFEFETKQNKTFFKPFQMESKADLPIAISKLH